MLPPRLPPQLDLHHGPKQVSAVGIFEFERLGIRFDKACKTFEASQQGGAFQHCGSPIPDCIEDLLRNLYNSSQSLSPTSVDLPRIASGQAKTSWVG